MEEKNNNDKQNSGPWAVPAAIVVAGLLIAGAVIYGGDGSNNANNANNAGQPSANVGGQAADGVAAALDNMAPITRDDHILGDINAPVKIVEYSDFECPFCKRFHITMQDVMEEYGKSGQVAWVYRHFPLDALHPKARKESEASECAADLGGNAKFWEFTNRIYEITPSNNKLDLEELTKTAQLIGLDVKDFEACLNSGVLASHVENDLQDAAATGGRGTPWSILVAKDGTKYPINGALPYSQIKALIDAALK